MAKWTEQEVSLLREVWPLVTSKNWDHYFPARTYEAVRHKAKCLKLSGQALGDKKSSSSWFLEAYNSLLNKDIPDHNACVKLANMMQAAGWKIQTNTSLESDNTFHVDAPEIVDRYVFGIISCTHLGSRSQQLTALNHFVDELMEAGGRDLFHAGDIVQGSEKMHRGMVYEIFEHGASRQRDYAVENFPRRPGLTTKLISGNHCLSFGKDTGFSICEAICARRDDMEFCGDWMANFVLPGGFRFKLRHGQGKMSYAISYKPQKLLEKWDRHVDPPHLFAVGHWHTPSFFPKYQGVDVMLLPAFQGQNNYVRSLGIEFSHVGGYICSYGLDEDGQFVNGSLRVDQKRYPELQHDY